jgi:hypothetical protein
VTQDRPDRVAFGQQPRVQAGQWRPPAAGDPVPQRLSGAAGGRQRPVGFQQHYADDGKQAEHPESKQRGVLESRADGRTGQHGGHHD